MQILQIILFGKNKQKKIIEFKENQVNIIQSAHNTGKSSLIGIIDYCLGQSKIQINSVHVRDTVAWFGIIVKIDGEKYFIARKNVPYQTNTDSMYVEQITDSSSVNVPITDNIGRKDLVKFLSDKIGIDEIPLEYRDNEHFFVSVRHALFFCYLTQNEISTTDFLYHRAHDGFINIQVEMALEYFLDSFSENTFHKYVELKELEQRVSGVLTKLKELEIIKGNVLPKAFDLLGRCQRYGLYDDDEVPTEFNDYVIALKSIVAKWKPTQIPILNTEINSLYEKVFSLREELQKKNEAYSDLKKYSTITDEFIEEADHQKNRLKLVEMFTGEPNNVLCPLCNAEITNPTEQYKQIRQDFESIEKDVKDTRKVKHYVGEALTELESQKNEIRNEINKISIKINSFLDEQADAKKTFDENIRISEIMGEIKLWLHSVEDSDENSDLMLQKKKLDDQIKKIRDTISLNRNSLQRLNVLDTISHTLLNWAKELRITDAEKYKIMFDVNMIKLFYNQNKILNYPNLGGGHNMLGLHLSLYLALHKYFLEKNRPTPHFVVFDQPSTAYFTEDPKTNNIREYLESSERKTLVDDFKFIIKKVQEMKNLQVIIMDQAEFNEDWFEERRVEDWGDALIPKDWEISS